MNSPYLTASEAEKLSLQGRAIGGGFAPGAAINYDTAQAESPQSVFTSAAAQIIGHNVSIREMAGRVRLCCDVLSGGNDAPQQGATAQPVAQPSGQIARLGCSLKEQAECLNDLERQLSRLNALLSA